MIGVAKTSRGLLVFAVPGGWGDWYEVALFDDQLVQLATDEDELHVEQDIVTSLVTLGLPEDEARSLAGQFVPEPPP